MEAIVIKNLNTSTITSQLFTDLKKMNLQHFKVYQFSGWQHVVYLVQHHKAIFYMFYTQYKFTHIDTS